MPEDIANDLIQKINLAQIDEVHKPGAQAVVDIVGIIGDIVGNRSDLRLRSGMARQLEVVDLIISHHRIRQFASGIGAGRPTRCVDQGPVVLGQSFKRLPGEVQPVEPRISPLKFGDHPQALGVMVETAEIRHFGRQGPLAGVPERWVSEVMRQGHGFGQILLESE